MKIQDVASMIMIRNFAFQAIDNILIKMSKEEVRAIQHKIPQLDKKIIESIVKLDLTATEEILTPPKQLNTRKASPAVLNENTK